MKAAIVLTAMSFATCAHAEVFFFSPMRSYAINTDYSTRGSSSTGAGQRTVDESSNDRTTAAIASFTETSNISGSQVTLQRSIFASGGSESGIAHVVCSLAATFYVDAPTPYILSVGFSQDFALQGDAPTSSSGVFSLFSSNTGEVFYNLSDPLTTHEQFTVFGVLQPGTYTLQFSGGVQVASAQNSVFWHDSLDLAFVPAPSAAITLGVCGMLPLRRRR